MYTAGTVYTSFILPILDFCDTVWSCCGSDNTAGQAGEVAEARSTYRYAPGEKRKSTEILGLRNSGEKA